MSLDPCVPPPSHTAASTSPRPFHRLTHHIGSRHFHRLRHLHDGASTAPRSAYGCGKHFADNQSGNLAARPTDGAPALNVAKGKAVIAKLAAGSAASLLGAAAVAGVLAMPANLGVVPTTSSVQRGNAQASPASSVVLPSVPGPSQSQPSPTLAVPAGPSTSGQVATPVPEPSSVALLGGFATLMLAASLLRRMGRKAAKPSFLNTK